MTRPGESRLGDYFLQEGGVESCVSSGSIGEFTEDERDRTGAFLIAEEALHPNMIASLSNLLSRQPSWFWLVVMLVILTSDKKVMGNRTNTRGMKWLGWTCAAVMTLQPSGSSSLRFDRCLHCGLAYRGECR